MSLVRRAKESQDKPRLGELTAFFPFQSESFLFYKSADAPFLALIAPREVEGELGPLSFRSLSAHKSYEVKHLPLRAGDRHVLIALLDLLMNYD